MATQGERRALFFLAAVALLGAGSRAWRSRSVPADTTALAQQIEAVDGAAGRRVGKPPRTNADNPSTRQPVDLDVAAEAEIEKLPGIGPALAKRIIKDRESNGPFGCLAALDRVKGVGPALLARIDSLATFSAAARTPCATAARTPE